MTIDISLLMFPVSVLCLILVVFSNKITNNEISGFWLEFSAILVISAIMILMLPETDAVIMTRMVMLCALWYTVGKRYELIVRNSKRRNKTN